MPSSVKDSVFEEGDPRRFSCVCMDLNMPLDPQNPPEGNVFRLKNVQWMVSCMELPRSKLAAIESQNIPPVLSSPQSFSTLHNLSSPVQR